MEEVGSNSRVDGEEVIRAVEGMEVAEEDAEDVGGGSEPLTEQLSP